ncbi:hypothetical protein CPB86DRAFT_829429 [Serendipita vermifera]|nr:hypothetical protein CPB86DRAFT_829429 [Serendipita vermifera]
MEWALRILTPFAIIHWSYGKCLNWLYSQPQVRILMPGMDKFFALHMEWDVFVELDVNDPELGVIVWNTSNEESSRHSYEDVDVLGYINIRGDGSGRTVVILAIQLFSRSSSVIWPVVYRTFEKYKLGPYNTFLKQGFAD